MPADYDRAGREPACGTVFTLTATPPRAGAFRSIGFGLGQAQNAQLPDLSISAPEADLDQTFDLSAHESVIPTTGERLAEKTATMARRKHDDPSLVNRKLTPVVRPTLAGWAVSRGDQQAGSDWDVVVDVI